MSLLVELRATELRANVLRADELRPNALCIGAAEAPVSGAVLLLGLRQRRELMTRVNGMLELTMWS